MVDEAGVRVFGADWGGVGVDHGRGQPRDGVQQRVFGLDRDPVRVRRT